MEEWEPGYPIVFTAQGDRTYEAIYKACIHEILKIYAHLNLLRTQFEMEGAIKSLNEVSDITELPATANVGDVYMVSNDTGIFLYAWNGTEWKQLNYSGFAAATEDNYGLVRLAALDDLIAGVLYETAVVTEWVLQKYGYITGLSVVRGVVIPWYGNVLEIPVGWAVCDGANGTPDLRDAFLRGGKSYDLDSEMGKGGKATSIIQYFALPAHTHAFSVPISVGNHRHSVSISVSSASISHKHSISSISVSVTTGGAHAHQRMSPTPGTARANAGTGQAPTYPTSYVDNYGPGGSHQHNIDVPISTSSTSISHNHQVAINTGSAGAVTLNLSGTTGSYSKSGSLTIDNKPAYMDLVCIMKL